MNKMNLVTKIEDRLAENKSGVKTYATYESAEKIGNKLGSDYAARCGKTDAVEFIVVFLPKTQRFSVVFRLMDFMTKHQTGGYVGVFAQQGFFSI
jgi:hypothetical protein